MYLSEVASTPVPVAAVLAEPDPTPVADPIAIANTKLEAVRTQREADHATLMKESDDLLTKAG